MSLSAGLDCGAACADSAGPDELGVSDRPGPLSSPCGTVSPTDPALNSADELPQQRVLIGGISSYRQISPGRRYATETDGPSGRAADAGNDDRSDLRSA